MLVTFVYFTRGGTSSKKGYSKLEKRKKHRNHLSAKFFKCLYLLTIFPTNRKVLSQNKKNFYKSIAVGASIRWNKSSALANELPCFVYLSTGLQLELFI